METLSTLEFFSGCFFQLCAAFSLQYVPMSRANVDISFALCQYWMDCYEICGRYRNHYHQIVPGTREQGTTENSSRCQTGVAT